MSHGRPAAAASQDDVDAALDRLWDASEATFRERVELCEDHVAAVLRGAPTEESRDGALAAAHKLAGTMGVFGMASGSVLAKELEDLFESGEASQEGVERMAAIVLDLHAHVDARAGIGADPDEQRETPPVQLQAAMRLGLVGLDTTYIESLCLVAEARGIELQKDALTSIATPDAILVSTRGDPDVADTVTEATRRSVPVVVIAESTDVSDRAEMLRAGAVALVTPLSDADAVVDLIQDLVVGLSTGLSVLAIGVGPEREHELIDGFASEGCTLRVLPPKGDLATALEQSAPDALLVGENLDGVPLVDAVAAIAADPLWSAPSLVAMPDSSEEAARVSSLLLAGGADDVVPASEGWSEIARRVALRTRRSILRASRSVGARSHRGPLASRLQARLDQCDGEGPCSVLYFRSRQLEAIDREEGYAAGDRHLESIERFLRAHFRSNDIVGAWVRGFIAVVDADRKAASDRLRSALANLEQVGIWCSGGVATAPTDGIDADDIVRLAEERAPGEQRPEVGLTQSPPRRIVVVEDDSVMAVLVAELLESDGHEVEVVEDGPGAVALLSDPDIHRKVSLVLLDVTLPGVDGFGVLRAMRQANTLEHVPVVMLTARTDEEEINTALTLGAVDHLAKPFSPQVLLRRVERALAVVAA